MAREFNTISLIGKFQSTDGAAVTVLYLAGYLRERGFDVWVEQGTAAAIGGAAGDFATAAYEKIAAEADLVVVVGGDGSNSRTMKTCRNQRNSVSCISI